MSIDENKLSRRARKGKKNKNYGLYKSEANVYNGVQGNAGKNAIYTKRHTHDI